MAERTKIWIANTLKKLLAKKPIEDIRVTEICRAAEIERPTFYYHFRDKYDLVNWIFYVGFIEEADISSYKTGWDWLADICRYFYREKEFYRAALRIEGQNSFRDYLIEMITPVASFFLHDLIPEGTDEPFVITFIVMP